MQEKTQKEPDKGNKTPDSLMKNLFIIDNVDERLYLECEFQNNKIMALLDSGASHNFVSERQLSNANIERLGCKYTVESAFETREINGMVKMEIIPKNGQKRRLNHLSLHN